MFFGVPSENMPRKQVIQSGSQSDRPPVSRRSAGCWVRRLGDLSHELLIFPVPQCSAPACKTMDVRGPLCCLKNKKGPKRLGSVSRTNDVPKQSKLYLYGRPALTPETTPNVALVWSGGCLRVPATPRVGTPTDQADLLSGPSP